MFFSNSRSPSVRQVGSNLVASFPNANPPLIWKFDLERNHSFSIAMQGEEGDWELGLTSPKGEFYTVAHFPVREDAEDALACVRKVLLSKRRSKWWLLLKIVLFLVVLFFIGSLIFGYVGIKLASSFMSGGTAIPGMSSVPSMPAAAAAPTESLTPGMPASADDVLRPPH